MACSDEILTRLTELVGEDAASTICADDASPCTEAVACAITYLAGQAGTAQTAGDDAVLGLDTMFLLNSGYMVFLMQLGFAMLCAGMIRQKSQHNILLKNLLDACLGGLAWYLLGYGFAFGKRNKGNDNSFIGNWNFALKETVDVSFDDPEAFAGNGYQSFFFQWAFAAAAATITSGAVAERCTFLAYCCYTLLMTAFTYPVVVHSIWSADGWLAAWSTSWGDGHALILKTGAIDFAGSGVVHMTGGIAALVGAWLMGPRVGRFRDGKVVDPMPGYSAHLVVLGTFILWFGWYGFNPGSQLFVAGFGNAAIVARVAVCTTLSAAAGGVAMLALRWYNTRVFDLVYTCNGILSGLVGITAGCSVVEPWAAIICGALAACVCYGAETALHRLHIDDVVSAFPVHGASGAWGVIFVGFLGKPSYIEQVYGAAGLVPGGKRYGWFYGGHGQVMLCQVIEVLFITAWVGACMSVLFGTLKFFKLLRVSDEEERMGLDKSIHGASVHGGQLGNGSTNGADMIVTARETDGAVAKVV